MMTKDAQLQDFRLKLAEVQQELQQLRALQV